MDVAGIRRRRISTQIHETSRTTSHAGHEGHCISFARRKLIHDDFDGLSDAGKVTEWTDEWNGTTRTALGERKLHVR
jgi:hypothetical protein